jgi:hypothetical protein
MATCNRCGAETQQCDTCKPTFHGRATLRGQQFNVITALFVGRIALNRSKGVSRIER